MSEARTEPPKAVGLHERAEFTLLHCGQPMRWLGSRTTWTGRAPDGTESDATSYQCDVCCSTAQIAVTEVGV